MAEDSLRTYDLDALKRYFDEHVPVGRPEWWIRGAIVNEGVKFKIYGISLSGSIVRRIAGGVLERAAAVKWLKPHHPCMRLDDLRTLQHSLGLDSLDRVEFLEEIRHQSREILREHPKLRLWVRKRLAPLDFALDPPSEMPRELLLTAAGLRNGLIQATNYLNDPSTPAEQVMGMADHLCSVALRAAAQAVASVLGKGPCRVSANLMLPITAGEETIPVYATAEAQINHARAQHLWDGLHGARTHLVIFGETESAGHLGFWVPVTTGRGGEDLPGAPIAYEKIEPTAVFKDDLPDLSNFSPEVANRWEDYMTHDFKEDLFISLPFEAPATPNALTGTTVPAVLNVNAKPAGEEGWFRAYDKDCLEIAKTRCVEFVEVAFYACLIKLEGYRKAGGNCPVLSTSMGWNSLPGYGVTASARQLIGGRADGQ